MEGGDGGGGVMRGMRGYWEEERMGEGEREKERERERETGAESVL